LRRGGFSAAEVGNQTPRTLGIFRPRPQGAEAAISPPSQPGWRRSRRRAAARPNPNLRDFRLQHHVDCAAARAHSVIRVARRRLDPSAPANMVNDDDSQC
jgi:hypothetical protein